MRTIARLAAAFVLTLSVVSPTSARMATIRTTAPLADQSEESITIALNEAVTIALQGVVAMGLRWFRVGEALVIDDVVSVEILATDTVPEGEASSQPGPGEGPSEGSERPTGLAL